MLSLHSICTMSHFAINYSQFILLQVAAMKMVSTNGETLRKWLFKYKLIDLYDGLVIFT